MALIRRLEQLQQNKVLPDSRDQFMLQRYLDELSNYAGTVYQDSILDVTERPQTLDALEDGQSDNESFSEIREERQRTWRTPVGPRSVASSNTPVDGDYTSSPSSDTHAVASSNNTGDGNYTSSPSSNAYPVALSNNTGDGEYTNSTSSDTHPVTSGKLKHITLGDLPTANPTSTFMANPSSSKIKEPTESVLPSTLPSVAGAGPSSLSYASVLEEAKRKREALVDLKLKDLLDGQLRIITASTSPSTVRELLERGADPNNTIFCSASLSQEISGAENRRLANELPLQNAAIASNVECLRILLQFGADPNLIRRNSSALHCAIKSGSLQCMRALLEAGAHVELSLYIRSDKIPWPLLLRRFDKTPLTPLQLVAMVTHERSKQMIELLLEFGADINYQGKVGASDWRCGTALVAAISTVRSLHLATTPYIPRQYSFESHTEETYRIKATIIEALLKTNANPNIWNNSTRLFAQRTALCSAIICLPEDTDPDQSFKRRTLDQLLEHGAWHTPPDSTPWNDKDMPLFLAILHRRLFSVDYLLEKGVDSKHKLLRMYASHRTTLEVAAFTHQADLVQRLISLGVDCSGYLYGKSGTPLHCAIAAETPWESLGNHTYIRDECIRTISLLMAADPSMSKMSVPVQYFKKKLTGGSRCVDEVLTPKELAKRVFVPAGVSRKEVFTQVLKG